MVMAALFAASPCKSRLAIAHANFGLRGSDSDADQALVHQWALAHQIPFYVKKFDTLDHAAKQKCSVEMAARELRYQWFEELRVALGYDYIALAHQANDNAETVLLNLTRGTGLRGLCGIPDTRGALIRPLLDTNRDQIEAYAQEHNTPFRVDATNALLDFHRNRIRHAVLPQLTTINPSLTARWRQNGRYLQQACTLLEELLEEKKRAWCRQENEVLLIDIKPVVEDKHAAYWLFELLHPYNFSSAQVEQALHLLHSRSGSRVASSTHILYRNRNSLALVPHSSKEASCTYALSLFDSSQYTIKNDAHIAALDAHKLHFPLVMRLWQKGDSFIPLGMKNFKKVSDYLIDAKVPAWQKEQQMVLCSNQEIVWLVEQRIDNRFKVTGTTKQVAQITINTSPHTQKAP